jgi:hypothetical protein
MSILSLPTLDELPVVRDVTHIGPATVVRTIGDRVRVAVNDETLLALCALPFASQIAPGDVVLVIGNSQASYVIGLLKGNGPTALTVPGDLHIRAPHGQILLTAATGIELKSDEVCIAANRLELYAKAVFERFNHVTLWVKETFQLRASRMRTRIEQTYDIRAERIVERADKDVKIDGETINLG